MDSITEKIRAMLYFRQFIENKIIKKRVYDLYLEEDDGFARFVALHLK